MRYDAVLRVIVDVVVADSEIAAVRHADRVAKDFVMTNRPPITEVRVRVDAIHGHVANDEVLDGDVVDVFVRAAERALRVVRRAPPRPVERGTVNTREAIPPLRGDRPVKWKVRALR